MPRSVFRELGPLIFLWGSILVLAGSLVFLDNYNLSKRRRAEECRNGARDSLKAYETCLHVKEH
jgi:hypothetical protein